MALNSCNCPRILSAGQAPAEEAPPLTQPTPPIDPTRNPIINTPYDPPAWHWSLDPEFRACTPARVGRRPSGAYLSVPKPRSPRVHAGPNVVKSCQQIEPHRRINAIRAAVQDWRAARYPGISPATAALIDHWNNPDTEGLQPFFCQRDAVETAIFLSEAPDDRRQPFVESLGQINAQHNDGLPRMALKLATGTGKTLVMAMLILWQAKSGLCRDFAILVPNLTIRDRLRELQAGSPLYDSLRPKGDRTRFRVTIINFQAWQSRTGVGIDGTMTTAQMQAVGLDAVRYTQATRESEDEMIDRLLATHRGQDRLCVLNDEAHHCYNGDRAGGSQIKGESGKEETQAMVWFGALQALHARNRLSQIFDLSATPMWLRRPTIGEPSVLFPWTVSDYPLVDAIEAGLVKIPRVPIRDESGTDSPAFRNLHAAVKDALGDADLPPKAHLLPALVQDALDRMVRDYENTCTVYEARNILPILIVVADTIRTAERLFAELGGWRHQGRWVKGRFPILSNITEAGSVKQVPPTLLVHSRMDESTHGTLAGTVKSSDNAAVHVRDETLTAPQRMNIIRTLFNTAGQTGQPGAHLRCIISVGMLTEGWDAKTVTHVIGYRSFGSDLLCEQVAGRALRRSVQLEPGAPATTEYANIIGIPFHYMQAIEAGDPGEQKERWTVHTVPGRTDRRIVLPCIKGWQCPRPGRMVRLNTPLRPWSAPVPTGGVGQVNLSGGAGTERALDDDVREQTALWQLAERVRRRCESNPDDGETLPRGRIESFASVVRATETYLQLRGIAARDLRTDAALQATGADIAHHLQWDDTDNPIHARMDDPATVSTADRHFETTLRRFPADPMRILERSEMNAAACHSEFECHVADLLEKVAGVDAWTRTFRLGWSIPWHDPVMARWHDYEPDFVARVPHANGGMPGYLIIEVKGVRDLHADEKMRAAQSWCERVTSGATGQPWGRWAYVMIDDSRAAGSTLTHAVNTLRAG